MLIILMGKSGAGKDTVQNEIIDRYNFNRFVSTTTRPMRKGEVNGREYHFVSVEEFKKKLIDDEFIETRDYEVAGNKTWYYGSEKNEISKDKDQIIILDPNGAKKFIDVFGKKNCFVVSIEAEDKVRRERAERRGSFDKAEWQRRLKDDTIKFADDIVDKLADLKIYNNQDVSVTMMADYIVYRFNECKIKENIQNNANQKTKIKVSER